MKKANFWERQTKQLRERVSYKITVQSIQESSQRAHDPQSKSADPARLVG
jgi:hypothetical protein